MAGKRILYFTTKGKPTSQKVWKALTTRGLAPEIRIPKQLSKLQQVQHDKLKNEFIFRTVARDYKPKKTKTRYTYKSTKVQTEKKPVYREAFDVSTPDEFPEIDYIGTPDIEVDLFEPEPTQEEISILEDFDNFEFEDLIDELEDIDEFVYIGGGE